jgi:hypothetical protein
MKTAATESAVPMPEEKAEVPAEAQDEVPDASGLPTAGPGRIQPKEAAAWMITVFLKN